MLVQNSLLFKPLHCRKAHGAQPNGEPWTAEALGRTSITLCMASDGEPSMSISVEPAPEKAPEPPVVIDHQEQDEAQAGVEREAMGV